MVFKSIGFLPPKWFIKRIVLAALLGAAGNLLIYNIVVRLGRSVGNGHDSLIGGSQVNVPIVATSLLLTIIAGLFRWALPIVSGRATELFRILLLAGTSFTTLSPLFGFSNANLETIITYELMQAWLFMLMWRAFSTIPNPAVTAR